MKKSFKNIVSCIIVICLTVSMLKYATDLMERKASEIKYQDFFDQEEDFDVLFFGTSHVLNAVYPMELWNDYGMISYNFGGHSNQLATSYWVMRNALDYTNPQLVVIDCTAITSNTKGSDIFSYLHLSLDAFPLSVTKAQAVWDLLNDPGLDEMIKNGTARESDEPRTKIGLLWDYSVYHSRWNSIDQTDFEVSGSKEKGAELRIDVTPGTLNKISPERKFEGDSVAIDYLCKTIDECQSRGIDVLLIYLPFPANEGHQMEANRVYDIAEEYKINYINFLDQDIVDYKTDCYDADSHLNPSGARKVTAYLGKYIAENYSIDDQRENQKYSFWFEDYKEYEELKKASLREQESLLNYLMLLYGEPVNVVIDVRNTDIFRNQSYLDILANLGVDIKELGANTDFINIQNGGASAEVLNDFRADEDLSGDFSIRCRVEDANTGEVIDLVDFIYEVDSDSTVNIRDVRR